jgi:hypothetical protein
MVDLMYAISIYEAWAPGPWRLMSGRLDLNARLALWMSTPGCEHTLFGWLQLSSHICVLERNPVVDRTLSGVRMSCWNVRTDSSWNSLKLLVTEEGPDGKFSSFGRMMLGQLSVRTEYHVLRTVAREPNLTALKSTQSLLEEQNRSVDSG